MTSSPGETSKPRLPLALIGKVAVLAFAISSALWFAYFAKALLFKYPPIGPDEAFFANPAINLLHHGTMSTDLLDGTLPGIGQRTYWMPPVYFLYVASIFRFTGPHLVALRLGSLAAALAVLVLTYLLAVRSGLGRWTSLLPASLVALDAVFLRGALMGRMDILALAFILLSLWLATGSASPRNSFLTGIACASATLTHPVGAVAVVSVVAWRLLWRETRTLPSVSPLIAGIAVACLPWLAYIALDPTSFVAQFGGQLVRKSAGHASVAGFFATSFLRLIAQYTFEHGRLIDAVWALPLWFVGMMGLGDSEVSLRADDSPVRRSLILLYGCQALIIAAVLLSSGEMWYTLYVIPITAIGVCHLLRNGCRAKSIGLRTVLTWLIFFWVGGFLLSNLQHVSKLNYLDNVANRSETNYWDWSSAISNKIPPGSRLLLSIIPDPYFGLRTRSDLSFRECLPDRIPIDHNAYWNYMSQTDYVIVGLGFRAPTIAVEEFLRQNGTLVDTVGDADRGYFARIYKVNKPIVIPH
jgi:4-amino-4-deoxy-L-arabinose transferase-like glycosyltransferase